MIFIDPTARIVIHTPILGGPSRRERSITMKQLEGILGIVFFTFVFLLSPALSRATPLEVTLFPASAQVLEVARLKIVPEGNLKKAIFTLPAQADPDSLVTRAEAGGKVRIVDQTWRRIDRIDNDRIRDLRKQIETLKDERNQIQAAIRALETQIQFWQMQTKATIKTISDAGHFSAAIGKNIKKAYEDKLARDPELEKLNQRIKELEEALNRTTGRKDAVWEVTLLLSGLSAAADVPVTYSYRLSGCGWSPLYRIEAIPQKQQVLFTWEAEIWQSSGQDWNQTAMKLATLQPATAIAPPDLPPWLIRPRPARLYREAARKNIRAEAMKALEGAEEEMGKDAASAPAPQEARQTTYSIWELGNITLPAGSRQRVKVQDETWSVEFVHLLRPGVSGKAFMRAALSFPEALDIPSGMAIFMIEGAILGKRPFAFTGKEGSLFFGEDPFVSAKVELLTKQSGEKTFLADRQTYKWEWRTDIENRRNAAIKVRIEEPVPQSRDERIKIAVKNEPAISEEKNALWIWMLDLPAGQKKSILTTVSLEAPKEMDLDLGWRK